MGTHNLQFYGILKNIIVSFPLNTNTAETDDCENDPICDEGPVKNYQKTKASFLSDSFLVASCQPMMCTTASC